MSDGFNIGIDVGGTNTDAVLMQNRRVVSACKRHTSEDIASGVVAAISEVLSSAGIGAERIDAVMVGTTHFVNAFLQRKQLNPVATLRVGLPMTSGIPPMVDWPEDLVNVIGANTFMVEGGSYYTGADYTALDEQAIHDAGVSIQRSDINSVAISSVFAPIRPDLETRAGEILKQYNPDLNVTLSHTVGGIGLIERENAAIINGALQDLANAVVGALSKALESLNMQAQLYFTQNDGTLMGKTTVSQFPVMTCAAGTTNSMRGAMFLTQINDAIVADVGGTTTDVGVLNKGFARETTDSFELGGVRTNFNIPDILSIALGGGTLVKNFGQADLNLGPESVGFRLLQEGKAFGGNTLTLSDLAIHAERLNLGDRALVANLDDDHVVSALALATRMIDDAVDQLRTSGAKVPVILVGGGSVILDDSLACASEVIRPAHGEVANAIGAAIAQVGGRVKRLYDFDKEGGREQALDKAVKEATSNAIKAGAVPDTIKVLDIEEFPMTHMQTGAVDVRVRVAGDLRVG